MRNSRAHFHNPKVPSCLSPVSFQPNHPDNNCPSAMLIALNLRVCVNLNWLEYKSKVYPFTVASPGFMHLVIYCREGGMWFGWMMKFRSTWAFPVHPCQDTLLLSNWFKSGMEGMERKLGGGVSVLPISTATSHNHGHSLQPPPATMIIWFTRRNWHEWQHGFVGGMFSVELLTIRCIPTVQVGPPQLDPKLSGAISYLSYGQRVVPPMIFLTTCIIM